LLPWLPSRRPADIFSSGGIALGRACPCRLLVKSCITIANIGKWKVSELLGLVRSHICAHWSLGRPALCIISCISCALMQLERLTSNYWNILSYYCLSCSFMTQIYCWRCCCCRCMASICYSSFFRLSTDGIRELMLFKSFRSKSSKSGSAFAISSAKTSGACLTGATFGAALPCEKSGRSTSTFILT